MTMKLLVAAAASASEDDDNYYYYYYYDDDDDDDNDVTFDDILAFLRYMSDLLLQACRLLERERFVI